MTDNTNQATFLDQAKSAASIAGGHVQYAQGAAESVSLWLAARGEFIL